MSGSLLAFFHLCLVFVLFSAPSLTEMMFYKKFSLVLVVSAHGMLDCMQLRVYMLIKNLPLSAIMADNKEVTRVLQARNPEVMLKKKRAAY